MGIFRRKCMRCEKWTYADSETSNICEACNSTLNLTSLTNYSDPARQKAVRYVIETIKELEADLAIYQTLLKELTK